MSILLDDCEYIFTLQIGSREYKVDLKWLLNLKVGITDDKSDVELEDSLQQISGYLHTFVAAYECASAELMNEELNYEIWYEKLYKNSEIALVDKNIKEMASGLRSKSNSMPTKSQVKTELITSHEDKYRAKTENLNNLKHRVETIQRELDVIKSRGTHLQTLIKVRKENRNIDVI